MKAYQWMRKKLIHGFWMRFMCESYLEMVISFFLHSRNVIDKIFNLNTAQHDNYK